MAASRSRFLLPVACAALFVALAPFAGVLRDRLRDSFGLAYLQWLVALLALAGLGAFALAIVRVRERRALRYGLLALAAGMVAWQVLAWGIGQAEVDVVERVHLVEFGLLGFLFERAFRARHRNALLPVLTLAAVGLAGLADEWAQWLTPVRTGDGRDVLLNLWAGAIGYLIGVALSSERGRFRAPGPATRRLALGLGGLFVLAAAAFFDATHLGHEIRDPAAGVFRSWHTAEELAGAKDDRGRRWAAEGVPPMRPLAREDLYLTEAGFHLLERNRAVERGALLLAWRENRILERWYTPILDHRDDTRWPGAQREHIEGVARERLRRWPGFVERSPGYRSPALADRIAAGPPRGLFWAFWFGALLLGGVPVAHALLPVVRWSFGGGAGEATARAAPDARDEGEKPRP